MEKRVRVPSKSVPGERAPEQHGESRVPVVGVEDVGAPFLALAGLDDGAAESGPADALVRVLRVELLAVEQLGGVDEVDEQRESRCVLRVRQGGVEQPGADLPASDLQGEGLTVRFGGESALRDPPVVRQEDANVVAAARALARGPPSRRRAPVLAKGAHSAAAMAIRRGRSWRGA